MTYLSLNNLNTTKWLHNDCDSMSINYLPSTSCAKRALPEEDYVKLKI